MGALALGEQHRAPIDAETDAVVANDLNLAARRGLMRTVPGIGRIVSLILLASRPELNHRQSAAVAPFATAAGTAPDAHVCIGGRAPVRTAMDEAAVTGVTHARASPPVSRDQNREVASHPTAKRVLFASRGACWW